MADELKTMAEELKTTAISKLPEAISVSEGDCILVVQNRKAKKARPSLFRGPKGDTGLTGATGANPVLKFSSRGIEAKLSNQADSAFTLLVPIASITGPTGPQGLTGATGANIIPRAGETGIEYKLSTEPDTAYRLLVPYSQITGPQGESGKDFQILGYFDTLDLLKAGITTPNPGDAYGVGTEAPYPIYIWDGINNLWRDNGAIQGPAGRSGKSARVNTDTGYWEEFDDDAQTWKQTEAIAVYPVATSERDGLMSKDDKAKLDQMKGGDIEVSKANIEKVFTGNITTHTHDTVRIVSGMPTDVWDGVTVSTALAGSGTVDDPYLIQSCADYIHFYRNPKLYGHDIDFDAGPTPEQLANPKQIKFTSNLDFNNVVVDFGDTVPDIMSGDALENILALCYIDGQGCNISNVNFTGTWAVIPIAGYSAIKNIHVLSGIFTIPLSSVNDKGFASTNDTSTYLTPWGLFVEACEVENVSFVAEVKFTGDIELQIYFVGGAIVNNQLGIIPGFLGDKPYFYSNATFSGDEGRSKLSEIVYIPAFVFYDDSATIPVTGYDLTPTFKDSDPEPTSGVASAKMIANNDIKPYILYINVDDGIPMYDPSSTTPFHTAKTTAEMKSPEFLALLNGDTETFVADTDNINDGYPIFKPNQTVQTYDGYVKESTFEAFKNNRPSTPSIPADTIMEDGYYVNKIAGNIFESQKLLSEAIEELGISSTGDSSNIINLDIDVSGAINQITAEYQTAFFGKTYTAPTSENIVQLLGGNEGIRSLVEKLMPKNNPIVTVPMMLYFYPSKFVSVMAACLVDGTTVESIDQLDGLPIIISVQFVACIDKTELYSLSISIEKFNTAEQTASYSWSSQIIGGNVKSDDIDQVKLLTQSEYDSLSSKSYNTLYLIKYE